MGIAKNIKTLKPNSTGGDGTYSVSHAAAGNGGEYAYQAGGQSGAMPYGPGLNTQRDAMAHVTKRIRSVMNNRSKISAAAVVTALKVSRD